MPIYLIVEGMRVEKLGDFRSQLFMTAFGGEAKIKIDFARTRNDIVGSSSARYV